MNRESILLSDQNWQLTWTDAVEDAPDWNVSVPAIVPGGILNDLLKAGRIEDPFRDVNFRSMRWTEEKAFHYRATIPRRVFRGFESDAQSELVFDCLDTFARVTVNGRVVADTMNMFRRHRITLEPGDLTDRDGLEIVVTIKPVIKAAQQWMEKTGTQTKSLLKAFNVDERPAIRKSQMVFGWDNCPYLVAGGIARDVRLIRRKGTSLGEWSWQVTAIDLVQKTATVEFSGRVDGLASGRIQIEGTCENVRFDGQANLAADGTWRCVCAVKGAKFWWPNGMGSPSLYGVRMALLQGETMVDHEPGVIALRTVEVRRTPTQTMVVDYTLPRKPRAEMDGGLLPSWTRLPLPEPEVVEVEPFHFFVNGTQVFVRGANMQTPDVVPGRIPDATYDQLTSQAQQANMNMLRLWGGGMIEAESFYSFCAQKGLMVWQDFYFACAQFPRTEAFLSEVKLEAEDMIKRLRNCPAIVCWCGDNESDMIDLGADLNPTENPINKGIIPDALSVWDAQQRYYHVSSPSGGGYPRSEWGGDRRNWGPWYPDGNYEHIRLDRGRFLSEGGAYAFPCAETMNEYFSTENQWPLDREELRLHTGDLDFSVRRFDRVNTHCWSFFEQPTNPQEAIEISQFAQALGMRRLAEHYRWRFPEAGGVLLWKLNDAWPAVDAGLIDYRLRPRSAMNEVGNAFAPVSVAFVEPIEGADRDITLWGYNDYCEDITVRVVLDEFASVAEPRLTRTIEMMIPARSRAALQSWSAQNSGDLRIWRARLVANERYSAVEARYASDPHLLWLFHKSEH